MIIDTLTVKSNREIAAGVYETVFESNSEQPDIKPGQFINIYPQNPMLTLPRPFAICDYENGKIKIVFIKVGQGTKEFSCYKEGETVKAVYPLGNGFDLTCSNKYDNHALIGGSIGAAPLLSLAKSLKKLNRSISVYLGFKNEPVLVDEFKQLTDNLFIATETGAYGEKGTVMDLVKKHDVNCEIYYACGPNKMLQAVCEYISGKGGEGQVSLEARMACGFGACVGCAVKIKKEDGFQYMKVCKDGPVFDYKEVLWD